MSEITLARTALASAALLLLAIAGNAQQAAKQEVPDNIAGSVAPAQPLPYSHENPYLTRPAVPAMPTNPTGRSWPFRQLRRAWAAHLSVAKVGPAIVRKLTEMSKSGQPIPWVRVYEVTPGRVIWSIGGISRRCNA